MCVCVCACVCVCMCACVRVCVCVCVVLKRLATPSDFYIPFLQLFHSPILSPLSLMAVYIPSFQVLRGRPRFFLPSGFH